MASAKEESEALGPGESHVQFYLPNGKGEGFVSILL